MVNIIEITESSGGTSSGAIASAPMPMGKKPIKREAAANWNATVQSIPRTEPFKHKKIVVKSSGGKTYTFDTEDEARRMFPDSWEKIKAGLKGFEVTGLSEVKMPMTNTNSTMFRIRAGDEFITSQGKVMSFATHDEAKEVADGLNYLYKCNCKVIPPSNTVQKPKLPLKKNKK